MCLSRFYEKNLHLPQSRYKKLDKAVVDCYVAEILEIDFNIMKSVLALNNLISLILLLVVGIIIGYEKRG